MPQVTLPPAPGAAPASALASGEVARQAADKMNAGEAAGAARLLETLPAAERPGAVRAFLGLVAGADPGRTAQVAAALPRGSPRTAALDLAAEAWVARDALEAARWAFGLDDPDLRFDANRAIADRWVARARRAALDRLLALEAVGPRDELLVLAAARLARRDASAALEWTRGLPEGELRNRVATSVGFEIAQAMPERAVGVVEMLPPGRDRWLLLNAIGRTWMARDPAAAMAWARELPAGEARNAVIAGFDAVQGVSSSRRGGDVAGDGAGPVGVEANNRVSLAPLDPASLPPGPERDRALRRKFEELLVVAPLVAATWLGSLPVSDRSHEMVSRLTRTWLLSDPAAAVAWMDQAMIPQWQQEELLREAGLWRR